MEKKNKDTAQQNIDEPQLENNDTNAGEGFTRVTRSAMLRNIGKKRELSHQTQMLFRL